MKVREGPSARRLKSRAKVPKVRVVLRPSARAPTPAATARSGRWRAAALALALAALPAAAHDADIVYVQAVQGRAEGALSEVATLTAGALGLLAPVDADGDGQLTQADLDARGPALRAGVWEQMPLSAGGQRCERLAERAALREGFVELTADFRCGPGELRQDFRFLAVLPTNYRVVVGSQIEGERGRAFAQGTFTALTIPRPAPPGAWSAERFLGGVDDGLRRALVLDALAFLALVFLVGSRWRALALQGLVALAGLAAASFLEVREPGPALALGLAAVAIAAGARTPAISQLQQAARLGAALLGGLGLGARGGGGPWPTCLGLAAGSAAVLLGAFAVAGPVGRMLARRPRAARLGPWVLAALALFSLGFRVSGLPGP